MTDGGQGSLFDDVAPEDLPAYVPTNRDLRENVSVPERTSPQPARAVPVAAPERPTGPDSGVAPPEGHTTAARPLRPPERDRPAPAHAGAGDTERAAAEFVRPKAGTLRADALDAFRKAGDRGLTDQELSAATGEWLYTIAPRRNELLRDLWVEDSGERRPGDRGRPCVVWRLTERGRAELCRT